MVHCELGTQTTTAGLFLLMQVQNFDACWRPGGCRLWSLCCVQVQLWTENVSWPTLVPDKNVSIGWRWIIFSHNILQILTISDHRNYGMVTFNRKANVNCTSVTRCSFQFLVSKSDTHAHQLTQPPHSLLSSSCIKDTLLPALALKVSIRYKSWGAESSNMDRIRSGTELQLISMSRGRHSREFTETPNCGF